MSARAAEKAARTAEEDALARTEAAQVEWGEHLSGAAFSPEFSRALAARVIERETAASERVAPPRALGRDGRATQGGMADFRSAQPLGRNLAAPAAPPSAAPGRGGSRSPRWRTG